MRCRPATRTESDRFIALDADRLEDAAGQADLVFDAIGGEVLARSPALLKPGGTLVTIKADALPPSRDDIRTVVFIQESSRAQLTELAHLVDQGHLRPQVGAVYPLAQAVKAYSAKAAAASPAGSSSSPERVRVIGLSGGPASAHRQRLARMSGRSA